MTCTASSAIRPLPAVPEPGIPRNLVSRVIPARECRARVVTAVAADMHLAYGQRADFTPGGSVAVGNLAMPVCAGAGDVARIITAALLTNIELGGQGESALEAGTMTERQT